MTSISFDRAAEYYDATRGLPEPLATHGIAAILAQIQTRPGALLLEVGAGTGRISLPLLARGANLVGCDLSARMLQRQRAKNPAARVAQANALRLPFANREFDGLLTIHVLHLIGEWRQALREFRRVLRPGAAYVNSWTALEDDDIDWTIRSYWRSRVEAHGAEWRRPGILAREELVVEARAMGARVDELVAMSYTESTTAGAVVDAIAGRISSDTWDLPAELFAQTVADLRVWAAEKYADPDAAHTMEHRLLLDVVRF